MEAVRLRDKYRDQIDVLIGFESEWLRMSSDENGARNDANSLAIIRQLQERYSQILDFYVGSVHHVHDIPIDYSREMYLQARALSHDSGKDNNGVKLNDDHSHGDMDEALFKDYFDAQYDMLRALKPPVIGHFDLIRLYSDRPNDSLQSNVRLWKTVIRNLEYIVGYGGILEINSSAIRKGLREPYPQIEVCKVSHLFFFFFFFLNLALVQHLGNASTNSVLLMMLQAFLDMGGNFTISDDSHRTSDIGMNYHIIREQVERLDLREFHIPRRRTTGEDNHTESKEYEIYRLNIHLIKNHAAWV